MAYSRVDHIQKSQANISCTDEDTYNIAMQVTTQLIIKYIDLQRTYSSQSSLKPLLKVIFVKTCPHPLEGSVIITAWDRNAAHFVLSHLIPLLTILIEQCKCTHMYRYTYIYGHGDRYICIYMIVPKSTWLGSGRNHRLNSAGIEPGTSAFN